MVSSRSRHLLQRGSSRKSATSSVEEHHTHAVAVVSVTRASTVLESTFENNTGQEVSRSNSSVSREVDRPRANRVCGS